MSTKVVLITGASGGIGRACAIALSEAYPIRDTHLVLVLSGRREAELQSTASQCKDGTTIEIVTGDVSRDADVQRMFDVVADKYGRIDVLFNNAGVDLLNSTPIEGADMAKFRQVLEVNVMAAVLCTAAATRLMKNQSPQGGRIINNGSISSSAPRPDSAAYTVSKHAVLGLTRSTSLDGRKYGITCTQLDIGNAQTDMAMAASLASGKGSRQADGSLRPEPVMDVKNVANTLVFLAGLPAEADVLHLEILAAGMPFVGRG